MKLTGKNKLAFVALILLSVVMLPASAGVYKWVDENGNVIYGDKPPDTNAKKLQIKPAPIFDEGYQKRLKQRQKLLDTIDDDRATELAEKQKLEENQALQAERCQRVQADLTRMQNAGYLYEETDDPFNPTILSDKQRLQEQKRYQDYLDKNC